MLKQSIVIKEDCQLTSGYHIQSCLLFGFLFPNRVERSLTVDHVGAAIAALDASVFQRRVHG